MCLNAEGRRVKRKVEAVAHEGNPQEGFPPSKLRWGCLILLAMYFTSAD
ncbi:hypothetical protein Nos7107_2340 [Nostoc sp. PCC 7107]|nr:hypothetical protein Nos7107_2340 [Nostoc sp. PCC 7107]